MNHTIDSAVVYVIINYLSKWNTIKLRIRNDNFGKRTLFTYVGQNPPFSVKNILF